MLKELVLIMAKIMPSEEIISNVRDGINLFESGNATADDKRKLNLDLTLLAAKVGLDSGDLKSPLDL